MPLFFNASQNSIIIMYMDNYPSIHPRAIQGLELFNRRLFFEAHEALELAWRAEHHPIRELYRGILQIGVAYYHLQRGNLRGAQKLLERSRAWLTPFPDQVMGIEVDRLRRDAAKILEEVIRCQQESKIDFNSELFKPIVYHQD